MSASRPLLTSDGVVDLRSVPPVTSETAAEEPEWIINSPAVPAERVPEVVAAYPYEPEMDDLPDMGSLTPLPLESPAETAAVGQSPTLPGNISQSSDYPATPAQVRELLIEVGGSIELHENGEVRAIDLSFSEVQDEQLQGLIHFPYLTDLDLTGTAIQDESIPVISGLKTLRALKLKGTRVTDAGFQQLAGLTELKLLDASRTAITDAGLAGAASWKQLTYLSLNHTAVMDAGLQSLHSLRQLRGVNIVRIQATPEGISPLQAALPGCLVISKIPDSPQPDVDETQTDKRKPARTISMGGDRRSSVRSDHLNEDPQLAQMIELAGRQPALAVHLSTVYSSGHRWSEAVLILQAALPADQQNRMIAFRLGEALAHDGRLEDAMQCFSQSVGEAAGHYNIGLILYQQALQDCEKYFERSLNADPRLDAARLRLNEIRRGQAIIQGLPQPASIPAAATVPDPDVKPGTHVYRGFADGIGRSTAMSRPVPGSQLSPEWLTTR